MLGGLVWEMYCSVDNMSNPWTYYSAFSPAPSLRQQQQLHNHWTFNYSAKIYWVPVISLPLFLNVEFSYYSERENMDRFLCENAEISCNIVTQKKALNLAVDIRKSDSQKWHLGLASGKKTIIKPYTGADLRRNPYLVNNPWALLSP